MKNNEKGIPEENQLAIEALSARINQLETRPIKNALPVGSILLSALSKTAFQAQYNCFQAICSGLPDRGCQPEGESFLYSPESFPESISSVKPCR